MLSLLLCAGKEVVVVGGDATYDTNKADVTAWSAGLGYHGLDYQLGGILTDRGGCTHAPAGLRLSVTGYVILPYPARG